MTRGRKGQGEPCVASGRAGPAFGLTDRGRIARLLRADLVLVRGNPGLDITATRDILRIWKGGHPVERPLHPEG